MVKFVHGLSSFVVRPFRRRHAMLIGIIYFLRTIIIVMLDAIRDRYNIYTDIPIYVIENRDLGINLIFVPHHCLSA